MRAKKDTRKKKKNSKNSGKKNETDILGGSDGTPKRRVTNFDGEGSCIICIPCSVTPGEHVRGRWDGLDRASTTYRSTCVVSSVETCQRGGGHLQLGWGRPGFCVAKMHHREQISPLRTKGCCCCCRSWLTRAVNRRWASATRHRGQIIFFLSKSYCTMDHFYASVKIFAGLHGRHYTDYAREPRSEKRTQVCRRQARHSCCLLFFYILFFFFYLLFLPFTFRPAPTRIRPWPPVRSPLSRLGR